MYSFKPFTLQLEALIQRVSSGRPWSHTLLAGLVLLVVGGIGIGATLGARPRQIAPAVGQGAQLLSAPHEDTTAYYLRTEQERAIRALAQSTPHEDTTAYYLRTEQERAIRALAQSTPHEDITAYYLRTEQERAVRSFWQHSK